MAQGLKPGVLLQKGTYKIEKVLGQGSFGITYLAIAEFTTHGKLGSMKLTRKVAIKEFFMTEVNSRQDDGSTVEGSSGSIFTNYKNKFKKEAENLSKLSHPDIVKVFDVFEENNTIYYVMDFIEGTNLDEYVFQKGSLEEKETISIIKEIGEALNYMHSRHMLHLDLKPRNVMRTIEGKYILIDFGLSKQFSEGGEPESSTSIGLGTQGYAPVEQASFQRDNTFPATLDIYALGATMFKMLTGIRPPDASFILNDGFPETDLESKNISPQTIAMIKKAMAPVKKELFQKVSQFLNALSEETIISKGSDPDLDPKSETPEPEPIPEPAPEPVQKSEVDVPSEPEVIKLEDSSINPHIPVIPKKRIFPFNLAGLYSAVAIVIVGIGIFFIMFSSKKEINTEENMLENSEIISALKENVPKNVSNILINTELGEARYSGQVIERTMDNEIQFIPQGKGTAKFINGELTGCTYEGEFKDGIMDGEANYTQKNGDIFIGKFKNNHYYEGKYIIKSSGEYYIGTFKDGSPDKGNWFDKDGKQL